MRRVTAILLGKGRDRLIVSSLVLVFIVVNKGFVKVQDQRVELVALSFDVRSTHVLLDVFEGCLWPLMLKARRLVLVGELITRNFSYGLQ